MNVTSRLGYILAPFWGTFVLISMETLLYFERMQYASRTTYSYKKNSNEILKSYLFNSANRMAVAFTVWKIQNVKTKGFALPFVAALLEVFFLLRPTNASNQCK